MAKSIQKFLKSAERMKAGKGRSARYPAESRAWAVRHAESEMGRGRTIAAVANKLGISDMTLRSWLYEASRAPAGSLCEVVVEEPPQQEPGPTLTLTTSGGHVVGGLDLEGVAALLRAMG